MKIRRTDISDDRRRQLEWMLNAMSDAATRAEGCNKDMDCGGFCRLDFDHSDDCVCDGDTDEPGSCPG